MRRHRPFGTTLLLVASLTGCTSPHLHNPANDTLATAANEAVPKLGIDEGFAAQLGVQRDILAKELALAEAFALADRDATLALVAISEETLREGWYEPDLVRRVGEVTSGTATLAEIEMARIDLQGAGARLEASRGEIAAQGLPAECGPDAARDRLAQSDLEAAVGELLGASTTSPTQADRDEALEILMSADEQFVAACATFLAAQALLAERSAGELSRLDAEVRARQAAIERATGELSRVRREFTQLDQAAAGAGDGDDEAKTPSQLVGEELARLRKGVKAATGIAGLFSSLGEVEQRLERVDDALVLLGGQVPDGTDATDAQRKVAVAFAGIVEIADKLAAFERAGRTMPRTDLVIVRGELSARRAGIQAAIARHRNEVTFLRNERAALEVELRSYREVERRVAQAEQYFARATAGTANAGKSVLDFTYLGLRGIKAASNKKAELARARALVKRAIVLQVDARHSATLAIAEARLRRAAAVHDGAIAQAQANTAQWMAIIQPLVAQQAQYHASGIKPEQVAALVFEAAKAAGLFAIAAGVN